MRLPLGRGVYGDARTGQYVVDVRFSSVLQATRLALSPPVTRFEIGVCTDVAKQHDTGANQHLLRLFPRLPKFASPR